MTANVVISKTEYQRRIESSEYTELENLTKTRNIKSETYTYYRVECKSKLSGRYSQHIVATYNE